MQTCAIDAGSTIGAPSQQSLYLVMAAEEAHEEILKPTLEEKTKRQRPATLEEPVAELPDSQPAVHMGTAKALDHLTQRQQTLRPLLLAQFAQAPQHRRVDRECPMQASSVAVPCLR